MLCGRGFIWRSRLGYTIRATGFSEKARFMAATSQHVSSSSQWLLWRSCWHDGLNHFGVQHRVPELHRRMASPVLLSFDGRNHPVGIIFANLFGVLSRPELDFEFQTITREGDHDLAHHLILGRLRSTTFCTDALCYQEGTNAWDGSADLWLHRLTIDATLRVATPLILVRWLAFF